MIIYKYFYLPPFSLSNTILCFSPYLVAMYREPSLHDVGETVPKAGVTPSKSTSASAIMNGGKPVNKSKTTQPDLHGYCDLLSSLITAEHFILARLSHSGICGSAGDKRRLALGSLQTRLLQVDKSQPVSPPTAKKTPG